MGNIPGQWQNDQGQQQNRQGRGAAFHQAAQFLHGGVEIPVNLGGNFNLVDNGDNPVGFIGQIARPGLLRLAARCAIQKDNAVFNPHIQRIIPAGRRQNIGDARADAQIRCNRIDRDILIGCGDLGIGFGRGILSNKRCGDKCQKRSGHHDKAMKREANRHSDRPVVLRHYAQTLARCHHRAVRARSVFALLVAIAALVVIMAPTPQTAVRQCKDIVA